MTDIANLIVGAGPYGLSIAAHLRAASVPYRLVGKPLESWSDYMPEGMVLKSEAFASNLWDPERRYTLERHTALQKQPYRRSGEPVTLARFLAYARWFQGHAVGEVDERRVARIDRGGSGFEVIFDDESAALVSRIVLATGHMAFRCVPPQLASLPAPLGLHSALLGDVRGYAGRDVTVVGAGQSALESAALLAEAGARVRVVVRAGAIAWAGPPATRERTWWEKLKAPESGLALGWHAVAVSEFPQAFRRLFRAEKRHRFVAGSWGPAGSWWLRPRFEGHVEALVGSVIREAHVSDAGVLLRVEGPSGASEIRTDHVISGTGFQIDVNRIDVLAPALRDSLVRDGLVPRLSAGFETSVPGLHIVGIASAPTFGPVMRFMFGAKHVAPVLARRLR